MQGKPYQVPLYSGIETKRRNPGENGRIPKITQVITADNFEDFVIAKQAAIDGDFGPLKEFKASLNLGLGQMKHGNGEALGKYQGQGNGLGKGQKNFYRGSK